MRDVRCNSRIVCGSLIDVLFVIFFVSSLSKYYPKVNLVITYSGGSIMIALSMILLLISSIFLFVFFEVSQIHPEWWEIPPSASTASARTLFYCAIFIVLSIVSTLISRKKIINQKRSFKIIYFLWMGIVLVFVITSIILKILDIHISLLPYIIASTSFWPGSVLSIIVFIQLLIIKRQSKSM